MKSDWLLDRLDNPIFKKHVRSRMRKQALGAAIVVVVSLCLCIAWGGFQLKSFENGGAFGTLIGLQAIILIVMGSTQIGASVAAARDSGILDFHRVSPLTPTELTLGFFFGAPIREYLLFACTLPFAILCLAFGTPSLHGFAQLMLLLVASAWLFHGLALLNALLTKARGSPRGVVFLVIFVVFFGGSVIAGLTRGGAFTDINKRLPFYGFSLPWLAVVLLHIAAILYFVYLAARRKMGSERIHPLSKPQSIAALATLSILLLGSIWRREGYADLEVVVLYVLVITAILLILMVTPNRAEYDKGLWRARKHGQAHLGWWNDLSINRVYLLISCAIVLATATFAATGVASSAAVGYGQRPPEGSIALAIACGVLVVAYFGLAHQYFAIRFGARGRIFFALFLFLTWVVPLVAGTIVLASSLLNSDGDSRVIFSLSPIAGLGLTAVAGVSQSYTKPIQAAAITPALLFTFVFNGLLVSARRRAYKEFLAMAESTRAK